MPKTAAIECGMGNGWNGVLGSLGDSGKGVLCLTVSDAIIAISGRWRDRNTKISDLPTLATRMTGSTAAIRASRRF